MTAEHREPFDPAAYAAITASVDCFVCAFLGGDPDFAHEIVFEDEEHVVFLDRFPVVRGATLVVPRRHVEHLARDLDEAAWSRLQAVAHRAARALERVVESERTYVLSVGSQQGNRHVHVHVVPLPPGTPPEQQQHAMLSGALGWVRLSEDESHRIGAEVRAAWPREGGG